MELQFEQAVKVFVNLTGQVYTFPTGYKVIVPYDESGNFQPQDIEELAAGGDIEINVVLPALYTLPVDKLHELLNHVAYVSEFSLTTDCFHPPTLWTVTDGCKLAKFDDARLSEFIVEFSRAIDRICNMIDPDRRSRRSHREYDCERQREYDERMDMTSEVFGGRRRSGRHSRSR